MTDLVITAANVVPGTGAKKRTGTAGATITAGQTVYLDSSDNKYKAYDADSGTAAVRTLAGIALNGASNGQPLTIQYDGNITIGATVAAGVIYVGSDTAGGIMPAADIETGDYVTVIGVGISTTQIKLTFIESGVAAA